MSLKNVPSEDEFAKASAAIRNRSRGLSEVRDKVLSLFKHSGELYEFFILDSSENTFRAYVFYRWDRQIEESVLSGLADKIKSTVFTSLEQIGRGSMNSIKVDFEFDSHETVERNFGGNYYNRLH